MGYLKNYLLSNKEILNLKEQRNQITDFLVNQVDEEVIFINMRILSDFNLIKWRLQLFMLGPVNFFNKFQQHVRLRAFFSFKNYYLKVNSFSTISSKNDEDWRDLQEQSIAAYYALQQIRALKDASTRGQRGVFSKEVLASKILQRTQEWNKKRPQTMTQQWNLKDKNLDKVWSGFNQSIGAKVNLKVWRQERFKEVATNDHIVLNPTEITGDIFNQLSICYSDDDRLKKIVKDRFVIAGEKGTGKSYAYFMYSYLSNFIIAYRMTQQFNSSQNKKRLFHFVQQQEFLHVKNLLYFPIKQIGKYGPAIDILIQQGYKGMKLQENYDASLNTFGKILEGIVFHYQSKYDIQTICLIDQANFYYSCFRKMLQIYDKMNSQISDEDQQTLKKLIFYKVILTQMADNGCVIIYNSSQAVEGYKITTWNSIYPNNKYFDLYDHQKSKVTDHYVKYSKNLDSKIGQLQLYDLFWKEICSKENNLFNLSNVFRNNIKLKQIFSQGFGFSEAVLSNHSISSKVIPYEKSLIEWGLDVKYLHIRKIVKDKLDLRWFEEIKLLMKNSQQSKENKLKIKNKFREIKRQIERLRYQQIKQCFMKYYNKTINNQIQRFNIICYINEISYQVKKINNTIPKKKKITGNDANSIKQNNVNQDQALLESNLEQFTKQDGLKYKVQVDFTNILPKKSNQSDKIVQIDHQKAIILQKQINNFIEECGIGYRSQQNKYLCTFIIDPNLLWKTTLLVPTDLKSYSAVQFDLLVKKIRVSRFTGNHMDILYFKLFESSIEFELIVDELQKYNPISKKASSYNIYKSVDFFIRKSLPKLTLSVGKHPNIKQILDNSFQKPTSEQMNLPEQFQNLFKQLKQSKQSGKYIVGFPVQQNIFKQKDFAPDNPLFDFVLVNTYSQSQQKHYTIHFYDLGVGKLYSKARDIKKMKLPLLIEQFIGFQYFKDVKPENIDIKHFILAPEEQVKAFFKQMTNKKNNKQMNDVMKMYWEEQTVRTNRGDFKITFGIKSANYNQKEKHLKLQDKNFQNLMMSTMQAVIKQLKIETGQQK